MKPSAAALYLETAIAAKKPAMLHGSPGIGKSDIVRQIGSKLGFVVLDIRLSQMDPVDMRGVPSLNNKTKQTIWFPPDFLPAADAPPTLLFFDEINSASQATQAAAYQLILDRRLGEYVLAPQHQMVAAGNRMSDRAIVNVMSTALKNRFTHIDVEVDPHDWYVWAFANDIVEEIIGYLRFAPDMLNELDTTTTIAEKQNRVKAAMQNNAFATPRSWHYLSDLMKTKIPEDIEDAVITGTVGDAAATGFRGYCMYHRSLPQLEEIIANPKKAIVPTEAQALFAVSVGLAKRATAQNIENISIYAQRLGADFQAMMLKDIAINSQEAAQTNAFYNWAVERKDILG